MSMRICRVSREDMLAERAICIVSLKQDIGISPPGGLPFRSIQTGGGFSERGVGRGVHRWLIIPSRELPWSLNTRVTTQ